MEIRRADPHPRTASCHKGGLLKRPSSRPEPSTKSAVAATTTTLRDSLERFEHLDELLEAHVVSEVELELAGRDSRREPRETLRCVARPLREDRVDPGRTGSPLCAACLRGALGRAHREAVTGD